MGITKSKYEFKIVTPSGSIVAIFTDEIYDRKYDIRRNDSEEISFLMDLDRLEKYAADNKFSNPLDIFNPNVNEIIIYRYNVPVIAGQINYAAPMATENERSVLVRANGFLDLFETRYTNTALSLTSTNLGDIAWDLIDHSQSLTNGDYGITQGTTISGTNRERNYKIDKNIKTALLQLSEVENGIDFEFTHDKQFNVYNEIGADTDILLRYPGNIISIEAPLDGSRMFNEIAARGSSGGDSESLRETYSRTDNQATFKRREKVLNFPSVVETDTLQEHAKEFGDDNYLLFDLPKVTVDGNKDVTIGDFHIGDRVRLDVSTYKSFAHLESSQYKIDTIGVEVDEDDLEEIKLGLSGV